MREKLRPLIKEEERMHFKGIFSEFGQKSGWKGRMENTVLFIDISFADSDEILTDHIWLAYLKCFQKLDLKAGDIVSFFGRIDSYTKGYIDKTIDYRIIRPTKAKIIGFLDIGKNAIRRLL